MLLGFVEFLQANWIWLTLGLIIVICIIVLLCTDKKDAPKNTEEAQNADSEIPEPGQEEKTAPEEEILPEEENVTVESEPEPEEESAPVSESEPAPAFEEEQTPQPEEEPAPVSERPEEETPAEPEPEPEVDEDDHNDVEVRHPDAKKSESGYRVVYDRETFTWVVKKDNNTRVTRRVKTKKEALEIAKELSKRQDVNMTVHKKDGKFQKKQK